MRQRIIVVGAGVVGLTCGVRLAESGVDVDVLARDLPPETASAAGGAVWLPLLAAPGSRFTELALGTLPVLRELAEVDGSGVRLLTGHLHTAGTGRPRWLDAVTHVVPAVQESDPRAGGGADGGRSPGAGGTRASRSGPPGAGAGTWWRLQVPVVAISFYLGHLRTRLADAGGTVTRLPLARLPEQGLVVNCTGSSARALADDPQVRPVHGRTVVLADPGLDAWWGEEVPGGDAVRYVLPHGREVVVGQVAGPDAAQDPPASPAGTPAGPPVGTLGRTSVGTPAETPVRASVAALAQSAGALVPALRGATVLGHRSGQVPQRPEIRLDVVRRQGAEDAREAVVHCYGHGDSGVTTSWGCADAVAALVAECR